MTFSINRVSAMIQKEWKDALDPFERTDIKRYFH